MYIDALFCSKWAQLSSACLLANILTALKYVSQRNLAFLALSCSCSCRFLHRQKSELQSGTYANRCRTHWNGVIQDVALMTRSFLWQKHQTEPKTSKHISHQELTQLSQYGDLRTGWCSATSDSEVKQNHEKNVMNHRGDLFSHSNETKPLLDLHQRQSRSQETKK